MRATPYQFPMGKVKSRGMDVVILDHQYQFPMGKVKLTTTMITMTISNRINSLWER